MHDSPLEGFHARHVRHDGPERASREDEVGRTELNFDAVADDGHVPAMVLGVRGPWLEL